MSHLKVVRLSNNAIIPTRATEFSAGLDLYAAETVWIKAHGKKKVQTDLAIEVPKGCYGRIAPRSGLTTTHFIDVGAGVLDKDFCGNVTVVLFNFSDTDFLVAKGNKIAQLICEQIKIPLLEECDMKWYQDRIRVTDRGLAGFGSSGM